MTISRSMCDPCIATCMQGEFLRATNPQTRFRLRLQPFTLKQRQTTRGLSRQRQRRRQIMSQYRQFQPVRGRNRWLAQRLPLFTVDGRCGGNGDATSDRISLGAFFPATAGKRSSTGHTTPHRAAWFEGAGCSAPLAISGRRRHHHRDEVWLNLSVSCLCGSRASTARCQA